MNGINIGIPLLLALLAGLSTAIGGLIAFFVKDFKKRYLFFTLGLSAGVMVYVSFVELLPYAIKNVGFLMANIAFFIGIIFILLIDFLIPHQYIAEKVKCDPKHRKLMTAGVLTAIGIAIHNLPEGLAVFVSSIGDLSLGISLAFAIALHNIPEGIAIAMPVYYATKSKAKALWFSLIAGFAEPIGALIGLAILLPILNTNVLSYSLAFVAGIMVFLSFDELLPLTFSEEKSHLAMIGVLVGMIIMGASLHLF